MQVWNYTVFFLWFSPCGSSHDTASILSLSTTATLTVMAHPKVMPHLMSHGGSDPHSTVRVVLQREADKIKSESNKGTIGNKNTME